MSGKVFFLLFVLYTHSAISSDSDSDSDSSDSQDTDIFLSGSFSIVGSSETVNVCVRSDGNIYMSSRNEFEIIDVVGRSTAGVIEVSDDIYQVTFDAYSFNDDSVGATNSIKTLTLDEETGQYTLTSNGETVDLLRTADEADPAECFMPAIQDYTVDFPIIGVSGDFSDICGFPCVIIEIFASLYEGCYGFYDTEQSEFVDGGTNSNNVLFAWDGELRIADFADEGCPEGTQFNVLLSEDTILESTKCAGPDYGGTFALSTECDAENVNICDMELECPLFSSGLNGEVPAKRSRMSVENSLESDGDLSERIVINLGNATIANLWGIVIVFVSVALVSCWLNKRNSNKII